MDSVVYHRVLVGDRVSSFPASTRFESWITQLRQPWMNIIGRRIWGGFAAALGDRTADWALQANLEHLPAFASPPSLPFIASERQLEAAISEASTSLAPRLPYAAALHRFDGTPLRLLLGLHFAGLDGAIVVQQNGRQFSLTLPLPAFADGWDPTPNLVVSNTPALLATLTSATRLGRSIPVGTPWFQLADTELTNRFAVIFPTWPFAALGFAFFNNSDAATVTWPVPFGSTTYKVIFGVPTDEVVLSNDATAQTRAVITLRASAPWTGIAWCIGWAAGINPFNTFSADSVGLLTKVINLTRPEKSYCGGVYAITAGGRTWDYFPPGTTWDGGTYPQWDTNTVSQILGAF